jgi:hypothetical protein
MPDSIARQRGTSTPAPRARSSSCRAERRRDREAGLIEPGPPIGPAEQAEWLVMPETAEDESSEAPSDAPS